MKINHPDTPIDGTSLQGSVVTTYADLVDRFGEPMAGDGYKTDAEWTIQENGTVATLYNWKNGKAYNGPTAPRVENIIRWNIGGHDHRAVELVVRLLAGACR